RHTRFSRDWSSDVCSSDLYKELCGCGVGFKLIQALSQKSGKTTEDIIPYLDFVATAIGADIVPITGENRVLAHFGMKQINNAPRVGFKTLTPPLDRPINMTDVIFKIAPRINAAGRMEHASYAVEILIEQRLEKAMEMAQGIETFNSSRKDLDKEITKAALEQIIKNKEED